MTTDILVTVIFMLSVAFVVCVFTALQDARYFRKQLSKALDEKYALIAHNRELQNELKLYKKETL